MRSFLRTACKTRQEDNNCLSEVSYNLITEESRERSCSFASRERMRSFLRTTCKTRPVFAKLRLGKQEDKKIKRSQYE